VREGRPERLVDRLEGGAAQVLLDHGAPSLVSGRPSVPPAASRGTTSHRPVRHVSVPLPHHTVRTPPAWRTPPPPRQCPAGARGAAQGTRRDGRRHDTACCTGPNGP